MGAVGVQVEVKDLEFRCSWPSAFLAQPLTC